MNTGQRRVAISPDGSMGVILRYVPKRQRCVLIMAQAREQNTVI
jgi:hypothetical protein